MGFRKENKVVNVPVEQPKEEVRNDFSFDDLKLIDAEYKVTSLLINYKTLLDEKIISKQEYEDKKTSLLDKLADITKRELAEGPSKKDVYRYALSLQAEGDYYGAIAKFESIRGYSDVEERIEDVKTCILQEKYDHAIEVWKNDEEDGVMLLKEIRGFKDSEEYIEAYEDKKRAEKYACASSLMAIKEYKAAITLFTELSGYKDADELVEKCQNIINESIYRKGIIALESNQFTEALDLFNSISEYSNSRTHINVCVSYFTSHYEMGCTLEANKEYDSAIKEFMLIPEYKDSAVRQGMCEKLKEEIRIEQLYQFSIFEGPKLVAASDEELRQAVKDLESIASYKKASKYIKQYKKILADHDEMKNAMRINIE